MKIDNNVNIFIDDFDSSTLRIQENIGETKVISINGGKVSIFFNSYDELEKFSEKLFCEVRAMAPKLTKPKVKIGDDLDNE